MPTAHGVEAHRSGADADLTRFTFSGLSLPDDQDPLGIWQLQPSRSPEPATALTAQALSAAEPEGLRWHIELPDLEHEAAAERTKRVAAELAGQLAIVGRRQAQLDQIEHRLSRLDGREAYGYAHTAQAALPEPEAALLETVAILRAGPQAFGLADRDAAAYQGVLDKAQRLLLQFRRLVQYYAWVETTIGAQAIGLTVVDWTGDYRTTWQEGVTASEMARHLDAMKLAMSSRHALLRLVSVVTSGALQLAAKAAVPGGQVLLLPAVYDYVRDVLAELDRYAKEQERVE